MLTTYTPRHRAGGRHRDNLRPVDSYSLAVDVHRAPAHRADVPAVVILGGVA